MKTTTHPLRYSLLFLAFVFCTAVSAQEVTVGAVSSGGALAPIGPESGRSNVATQEVEIDLSELKAIKSIVVNDSKGVRVNPIISGNTDTKMVRIDIAALSKGIYFLEAIDSNNQTVTRQIVKE